jgi:hypothetical protein
VWSILEQSAIQSIYICRRKAGIQLLAVELNGKDGLGVTFSDRTTGAQVVKELLELWSYRGRLRIKKIQKCSNGKGVTMTILKATMKR